MYKVTTIKVNKTEGKSWGKNIYFTCDSFVKYDDFYSFTFGYGNYAWSHSIETVLIKSIEKL